MHGNKALYAKLNAEIVDTAPTFATPYGPQASRLGIKKPIEMSEVREAIERNLTWELPSYVPFEATKGFLLAHICLWKEPTVACFEAVSSNLTTLIDELLADPDHFGRFAELRMFVRDVISEEEAACTSETSTIINKLYNLENSVPFYTQNAAAYQSEIDAWYTAHIQVEGNQDADVLKVMADVHAYFQVASKVRPHLRGPAFTDPS